MQLVLGDIRLGLAIGKDAVDKHEVALVPALHGPVASLQQNSLVVWRLGDFHVGVPIALHDFPHMALAVLAVYIAVYVGIDVAGADVSGVACGGAISVQIRTVDLTEVFIVFFAT